MLDARTSAADSDSETPVVTPVGPIGPRSARKKKRGLFHRSGIVVPALVIAMISLAYLEEDGLLLAIGLLLAVILLTVESVAAWGTIVGAKRLIGLW